MKIGIDYDDVLVDTFPSFIDFHNHRHGTNFRIEDITSYFIWEVGIGRTKEEAINFFREFYDSLEFDEMPLVEGAREGVLELSRLSGRFVEVVTSRPLEFRVKTIGLIRRRLSDAHLTLHYSSDFHNNANGMKAEICQALELDYYAEDCFAYARDIAQRGIRVLLRRRPWNENEWRKLRAEKESKNGNGAKYSRGGIIPIKNWQEILDEIKNVNGRSKNGVS